MVALDSSVDPEVLPFAWYKHFVVEGATEHGLPETYIDFLKAIPATEDPGRERDRLKRAIAKGLSNIG